MAVLIASDLAKDMAGVPLLRGVSFRLERRDRLTLSGRNGSGKTTLLRMLAGETTVDGGELNLAKDVRVALHDQRPPRERALSLRDYVLSGCKDLLALEDELAALELAMAGGDTSPGTLEAYATAQARLEHAGGYTWLEGDLQTLDAAIVLVAHDRWFLEAVGTSVLELEAGRARFFKGTWHAWRK